MKKCEKCGYEHDNIIITLKDAVKERHLCPNCVAYSFLENELSFINDHNLVDDISGKPGAVEFVSNNERYCLEKRTMMRLLSYNLQRHEYLILVNKYGSDKFMLHEDFYWNDGTKLQPML